MLRRAPCRLGAIARQKTCRPAVLHQTRLASIKTPDSSTSKAKEAPPPIRAYAKPKQAPPPPPSTTPIPPSPPPGKDRNYIYAFALATKCLVVVFLGGHIFMEYFYLCSGAYGISMLPNLNSSGEWLWISKYYRRGRGIKVGDVVSFQHPVRVGDYAVKRIIGLEGDFVLMNTPGKSDAMIQVPEGHCWVVGDNLPHSRDSRMFGPLPMALISGKVIARWGTGDTQWLPRFSRLGEGLKDTDEYESAID